MLIIHPKPSPLRPENSSNIQPVRCGSMYFMALLALSFSLGLQGCSLDKSSSASELAQVPTRDSFNMAEEVAATEPAPLNNWLSRFADPALTALVREALANNPEMALYAARRDEVVWRLAVARSYLLPQVSGTAGVGRTKTRQPESSNQINAAVGIAWEADVWGRLRYGERAAEADIQVAQNDLVWARQLLAAQVAQAWYLAIAADLQRQIDHELLSVQEKTLKITRGKVAGQQATRLELELAQANVAQANDDISRSELAYTNAVRGLELLLGRFPSTELKTGPDLPVPPLPSSVGVPSELLERRPDIIAADRAVAAAFNRVGQAKAAKLPSVVLTGSLGYALDPSSLIWSIGANLLAPLYRGGALDANIQITEAQQRAALARYVQAGIRAFGEVENALAASTNLQTRQSQLEVATEHLDRASQIAQRRYDAGELSIIDLNQVRVQYFSSRAELNRVRAQRVEQSINLYFALGGFWDAPGSNVPNQVTADHNASQPDHTSAASVPTPH